MGKSPNEVKIRAATHEDINDIVRIDTATYKKGWAPRRFHTLLENNKSSVILVAGHPKQVANAYVIYDLLERTVSIRRMAAYPEYGSLLDALIERLKKLLHVDRRNAILMYVPETHLSTQILLREQGFRAERQSVVKKFFPDTDEDAYILQYRLGKLTVERSKEADVLPPTTDLCQLEDAQGSGQ